MIQNHLRRLFSLTGSALIALALPATTHAQSAETLWNNNCASCHGKTGAGGGAGTRTMLDNAHRSPDWFPDSLGKEAGRTDRQLFDATKFGNPESGMPAFKDGLDDPQIWLMVNYLRELQEQARRKDGGPAVMPKAGPDGVYTSKHVAYKIETIVAESKSLKLDTPWSVDFLPSPAEAKLKTMLLTERNGNLRTVTMSSDPKVAAVVSEPISGMPAVRNRGQGGLMDVAVHPDYANNKWIYLSLTDPLDASSKNLGTTKIVRGKLTGDNDTLKWTDEEVIWKAKSEHYTSGDLHFGSRIVFDKPDASGKRPLFFCIGERGRAETAQDLTKPNGKVHRIFDDGTIPTDNPFVSQKDAYASIWSYGHRNPQGLVLDAAGNLWDTEHGPRGGDELNLVKKGANYGWPIVSHGVNYSGTSLTVPWADLVAGKRAEGKNITEPTFVWLPSIAASGLDELRPGPWGEVLSQWKGDLFAGGIASTVVDRLRIKDGKVIEREEVLHGMGRVRDVVCGPEGAVYVVLNGPDKVVRLVPAK